MPNKQYYKTYGDIGSGVLLKECSLEEAAKFVLKESSYFVLFFSTHWPSHSAKNTFEKALFGDKALKYVNGENPYRVKVNSYLNNSTKCSFVKWFEVWTVSGFANLHLSHFFDGLCASASNSGLKHSIGQWMFSFFRAFSLYRSKTSV